MLRIAVVGAGIMGANHARIGSGLRDIEVAVVVDPDLDRARTLAESIGAAAATTIDGLAGAVDAAVVAVPTDYHHVVTLPLIEAGINVLVEKPLAATVEQAQELVDAAAAAGVVLAVGHVERFNPAVLELANLVDRPIHLSATRIGPYSSRVSEGVVRDLMIHDLDIIRHLVGSEVVSVQSVLAAPRSATEDLATVLLAFANGVTAQLTASRIGQQKIRELQITQAENYLTVDLLRQDVTINRVDHSEYLSDAGARYRQTGVVEIPFLEHRGEPLALELGSFANAVTRREVPQVTGQDGVEALRLVDRVLAAAVRA